MADLIVIGYPDETTADAAADEAMSKYGGMVLMSRRWGGRWSCDVSRSTSGKAVPKAATPMVRARLLRLRR